MSTIITRAAKGQELEHDEMDQNLINLNTDKVENVDHAALAARVSATEAGLANTATADHEHTADEIPVAAGSSVSVQAALVELDADKESRANRGAADGYAPLGSDARVPLANLPDVLSHDKGFFASPAALTAAYPIGNDGDHAIVDTTASVWLWDDGAWTDSGAKGAVHSVNGQTGIVQLSAHDVGAPPQSEMDATRTALEKVIQAVISTGLVQEATETFELERLSASLLKIHAVTGAFFDDDLSGTYAFPEQTVDLNAVLSLADGLHIQHLHLDKTGTAFFLDQRDADSPNLLALGIVYLQVVGGVINMPAELPPLARPAMAANSSFELAKLGLSLSVTLAPNANLSLACSSGQATGESVNWIDRSAIHVRPIAAQNPLPMRRIHAGVSSQLGVPATTTLLDPTQFWNGVALAPVGGSAARSTVQRLIWSPGAGFAIQYGEAFYATLSDANNAMAVAPFTSVFPGAEGIEIARIAVTRACTDLTNTADCVIRFGAGLSGGGSSQGTTSHDSLTGLLGTPGQLHHPNDAEYAKLLALGNDVQEFTFSGTWTKPADAKAVFILLIAPGAGGACGEKRATGVSKGGDSGGGGGMTLLWVPADWLTATASIVIGTPGVGAPGRTDEGPPVLGTRGGDVVFTGGLRLRARGGHTGITDSNGDNGIGTHMGFSAQAGAGTFAWGTPYAQRQRNGPPGCICGNPGGGITAADALLNPPVNQEGGGAGFVIGAFGDSGPSGPYPSSLFRLGGRGGLGGYAAIDANGTDGTAGLNYGAGGGAGGATRTGSRSGSGGNGAYGIAIIITIRG
ncbi:hypothetical protein [Pseudoxanthomonas sp. UTMC 1351]|uniref:glycine-rich domain-containing protein n=1 Tax=Pseudoxanthomonas sp. UTMC 1351 TaxID=2695853 RepID=UPI0034CE93FF